MTYINATATSLQDLCIQVQRAISKMIAEYPGAPIELRTHNSYAVPPDLWPGTGDVRHPGLFVETFVFVHLEPQKDEKTQD